jgi:hypothetical protein
LDVSAVSEEMETENPEDSLSFSETSDLPSDIKTSIVTSEGESTGVSIEQERPQVLARQWSEEEETWDTMVSYIRAKCEAQTQMEDIKTTEEVNVENPTIHGNIVNESHKEAIQRRMSIANLL